MKIISQRCVILGVFVLLVGNAQAAQVAQRCKANKTKTTPTEDFVILRNGHVKHNKTGLIWKRCVEGMTGSKCDGEMKKFYWEDLTALVKEQKKPGWRVPTIDELKSITEKSCKRPAMNLEIFPNTPSIQHWSSSEIEGSDKVWLQYVTNGVAVKGRIGIRWPVRLVKDN